MRRNVITIAQYKEKREGRGKYVYTREGRGERGGGRDGRRVYITIGSGEMGGSTLTKYPLKAWYRVAASGWSR